MGVGIIRVCVGSLVNAKVSKGSFVFAWVHSRASTGRRVRSRSVRYTQAPSGRLFQSGSLGFTQARLLEVGFIRVRKGSLRSAESSPA